MGLLEVQTSIQLQNAQKKYKITLTQAAPTAPALHWQKHAPDMPLGIQSDRKISKCGNTSSIHCQILKGAKVQLFQVGNRTCIVSYHTSESCTFALYLFLDAK
jgi:hypothetical protein